MNEEICSAAQKYARCILASIKDIYADCIGDESSVVIFGVNCATIPRRKYISSRSYASNPWFVGRPVVPGPTHTAELLEVHLSSLSAKHIARNWIVHNDPRLLRIPGKDLQEQLLGAAMIDHGLGCVILRRMKQLNSESSPIVPYLNHHHILEVDFSTLALAGSSLSRLVQLQNQFVGSSINYSLEFYITAILHDGWAGYIWDMLTRFIQVFDPSIGPKGCTREKQTRHKLIAPRLHDALFGCLTDIHAGWPTPKDNWTTTFPKFMDYTISRKETGIAVMHIICFHDGHKLRVPITKNNLAKTKKFLLQEVMKLQGNNSSLLADDLWSVHAPRDGLKDFLC